MTNNDLLRLDCHTKKKKSIGNRCEKRTMFETFMILVNSSVEDVLVNLPCLANLRKWQRNNDILLGS